VTNSHANEAVTALRLFVVAGKLFQGLDQIFLPHLLESPGRLLGRLLGGGGQELLQIVRAERFLGGEQDRLQDQFQFHVRMRVR
jgi:hypothetical protein